MRPLVKLCKERNVRVNFVPIQERSDGGKDWPAGARHYIAIVMFHGKELQTEYSIGPAVKKPRREDLIASLLLDASSGRETFEDFCSNLGYDTDSRKAHATWLACQSTSRDVKFLFGLHLASFEEAAADW